MGCDTNYWAYCLDPEEKAGEYSGFFFLPLKVDLLGSIVIRYCYWSSAAESISYEELLKRLTSLKNAIHVFEFPVESKLSSANTNELERVDN